MRARLLPAVLPVASVVGVPAHAADPPSVQVAPYSPFVGSLHEHSGYSDGRVGSTPANYDATAKQL